ncbi:hypothetical protein GGR39_002129 [Novosphingobium fluoreni]|uniref:Uncharacterized protein n=1 Tax=Novosphingobium fluoreni TaxID=1391222 RepID=A0A7W6FZT5_9SPHN|nr:hypothetical protein [Novosphingobium fluoreni]
MNASQRPKAPARLTFTAARSWHRRDDIPLTETFHTPTDGNDLAGELMTNDAAYGKEAMLLCQVDVRTANTASLNPDDQLSCCRLRVGYVFKCEGRIGSIEDDGFHAILSLFQAPWHASYAYG